MNEIRTVIVDDEPPARKRIRAMLADEPEFVIIAECGDGGKAIEVIEESGPDLVFLDVQMPQCDGFDVLRALDPGKYPMVIFVTAYDRYAVKAFDVHAIDYLLKPYDRKRFKEALERARSRIAASRLGEIGRGFSKLLEDVRSFQPYPPPRLVIKSAGSIQFLPVEEIDWIEGAGNYVRVHADAQVHLIRETMSGMEKRLDPERFVRIHRSAIVQLNRIKELQPAFSGEYAVILETGEELKLTRSYRTELEKRLGKLF